MSGHTEDPRDKNRGGRGANDPNRKAGQRTEYFSGGAGITRAVYISPFTGAQFETRQMLAVHCKAFRQRVLKDFDTLVRQNQLGVEPWERLPTETPLNYRRFQRYIQLPVVARSIAAIAKVLQLPENRTRALAAKWHWKKRSDLWERHLDKVANDAHIEQTKRASRNQASLGRQLQRVALKGAESLLESEERLAELSGNEIAKLADVGVKVERLANGDPTKINEDRGVVLVWEGSAPSWAPRDVTPEKTIEGEG